MTMKIDEFVGSEAVCSNGKKFKVKDNADKKQVKAKTTKTAKSKKGGKAK